MARLRQDGARPQAFAPPGGLCKGPPGRVGLEGMRERDTGTIAFSIREALRSGARLPERRAEQRRAERQNYGPLKEPNTLHDRIRLRVDDYLRNGCGRQIQYPQITQITQIKQNEKHRPQEGTESTRRSYPNKTYAKKAIFRAYPLCLLFLFVADFLICVICGICGPSRARTDFDTLPS